VPVGLPQRTRFQLIRCIGYVIITAIRDDNGSLIGFGKVTRDLTNQRRSETAIRRSEEHSRLFVDAVQDYEIFILDSEGCVSTWNTGAERIKGYKASEIIGQHFPSSIPMKMFVPANQRGN
jgi:PAS domain-containing protein